MTDERLIEEAAKAIADVHNPGAFEKWPDGWIEESRAALAVFEKAHTPHTPNDDERRAGWSHPDAVYSPEVFMAMQELLNEAKGSPTHALRLAVSRQLAESTAPMLDADGDPISSGQHRRIVMPGSDLPVCDTCTNVLGLNIRWDQSHPEPQGEPSDATTVHLTARREGKTQALIDSMLAQANERGIRVEVSYPQSEPSGAQVEAAAKTLANRMGDGPWEDVLDTFQDDYRHDARAALRAASEVGGEGR